MNYQLLRDILAARRTAFGFLALVAILNLALMLYLSLFQKPELAQVQSDWTAQREAAARGQRVGNAARYQDGVRDLGLFQERLIPKKDFALFLGEIFEMASKNSLTLKGVTYKPPAPRSKDPIPFYGIAFTVSGKYPQVKSFIADLARYRRMVTLDTVSLNSASQIEEVVDLKVQLTAYLKVEGA